MQLPHQIETLTLLIEKAKRKGKAMLVGTYVITVIRKKIEQSQGTYFLFPRPSYRASLVAQMVENLPAVQETRVRSLGQEGPLEKEMTNYSSILAWRIPRTEKPDLLQSMGL